MRNSKQERNQLNALSRFNVCYFDQSHVCLSCTSLNSSLGCLETIDQNHCSMTLH